MEGRAALRSEVKVGPTPIRPPVKDHPHTEANSVVGGPIYRGKKLPALRGSFVYGDYITGTIWAIGQQAEGTYSHETLLDTDLRIVAFAESKRGELYVVDYDSTGQIYELLPANQRDNSAAFPRRLSETGLFASLKSLEPATGVVPYEVKVPRWMDGASARRWIAIPRQEKVAFPAEVGKPTVFPEGTVLVKHIEMLSSEGSPPQRLETQLLHREDGSWRTYSYLWDEDSLDAALVDAAGGERTFQGSGDVERTWRVSATNECRLCHDAGAGTVLGFAPSQLDLSHQLTTLAAQQAITAAPEVPQSLELVDPHDDSESLDDRARSYLHANCSMCHHRGGNAIASIYLRRDLPLDQLNTNKGTIIGTFGMRNAKVIAAGDPYRSVMMYRMSTLGFGRMPYIGSYAVDSAGVALIAEWIRSLPSDGNASSPPLTRESPEAAALATLNDSAADATKRTAALTTLTSSTEGSLALLARMHGGKLNAEDFTSAVALGRATSNSDLRGLFEHFVPEDERRKRLGPNIKPESILSLAGDVERGKLIYFSDVGRCRACHELSDAEKSLGPTLAEINTKYVKPLEMLQHVLEPSLKIDDKFATYTVVTKEGRVKSGLLVEKDAQRVRLRSAENKIIDIPIADVDQLEKSTRSLMPDKILSDLTAQEAADLLHYIRQTTLRKRSLP
jgi:putative heme-binding domain-containing protein